MERQNFNNNHSWRSVYFLFALLLLFFMFIENLSISFWSIVFEIISKNIFLFLNIFSSEYNLNTYGCWIFSMFFVVVLFAIREKRIVKASMTTSENVYDGTKNWKEKRNNKLAWNDIDCNKSIGMWSNKTRKKLVEMRQKKYWHRLTVCFVHLGAVKIKKENPGAYNLCVTQTSWFN